MNYLFFLNIYSQVLVFLGIVNTWKYNDNYNCYDISKKRL